MFMVDEETAAAIRRAWDEGGELSAVVELRRHFPLITGTVQKLGEEDGDGMTSRAEAGWESVDGVGAAAGRDGS